MLLALLSLFCFRITRLVVVDEIFDPPRDWLHDRLPAKVVDGLDCCWCTGVWISALVVGVASQLISIRSPVLYWGAVSAIVGLASSLDGFLGANSEQADRQTDSQAQRAPAEGTPSQEALQLRVQPEVGEVIPPHFPHH